MRTKLPFQVKIWKFSSVNLQDMKIQYIESGILINPNLDEIYSEKGDVDNGR